MHPGVQVSRPPMGVIVKMQRGEGEPEKISKMIIIKMKITRANQNIKEKLNKKVPNKGQKQMPRKKIQRKVKGKKRSIQEG